MAKKKEEEVKKPNIYDDIIVPNLAVIKAYIRDGYNQKQIAEKLGISESSIKAYKTKYPEFNDMWLETREKTDIVNVVGSYYRQATGYTVVETEKQYKYDKYGKKKLVGEKVKERYIPPVEKATANWIALRLKKHEEWGKFAELLYKQSEGQQEEEAGVVLMPPKLNASEEKIIEVKVREVVKDGGNPVETTSEAV